MTPRASVCLYWDYDTQWGADRSRAGGGPKDWGPLEFENTERLLELHAEHEVPACFAVVGAAALPGRRPYHDPAQVRRIHEAGHEVASHTFRHDWIPALGPAELRDSLGASKDALEQCIGAEVVSLVPPYNQPFDYPGGLSFSLSERRAVRRDRTDLGALCEALRETGYRTCRVAYRPVAVQLAERVLRRRLDWPMQPRCVGGVLCLRLNSAGGFGPTTMSLLERCVETGGMLVVYGHPHSIRREGTEHERYLTALLQRVQALRSAGRLRVVRPRDLLPGD